MLLSAPVLLAGRPAPAQATVEESEAGIVLEIQRLMQEDQSIEDQARRRAALLENLRKIPPLVVAMDRLFPQGKHRPLAHRQGLQALVLRRSLGDKGVTLEMIAATAKELLGMAKDDDTRAEAEFLVLQTRLADIPVTSRPATTATATATTTASSNEALLAALAGELVKVAGDYPRSPYAATALYLAGASYLELGRNPPAIAALDRLSRDYPKDPYSLKAAMILVQLHTDAARPAEALVVKRRCVENFPDSPAAIKYKADIAHAECVGRPFFLRFKSVQGKNVDVTEARGKVVLAYFYISLTEEQASAEVLKILQGLGKLARERGCVLVAIGADEPDDADKVAKALADAKIDTPVLLDAQNKVAQQYGVTYVPSVVIVGADGTMREVVTAAEIVTEVEKALKLAASQPAKPTATRPGK